ncbi:MAG: enoyl-ACP reductase [Abditibacteriaceae bacterium]
MNSGNLSGKVGLVFGIASHRSIAWGVAQAWASQGADLVLSYQDERIYTNVEKLAEQLRNDFGVKVLLFQCDVSSDEQITSFYASVREHFDHVDLLLHSLAYAPREALDEGFTKTSRSAFYTALNISVYSLVALTREALPLMPAGSSVLAMTFLGSQKVIPHYNVMGVAKASLESSVQYLAADLGPRGIRVNALSAGPMQTLSARGIADFSIMHKFHQEHSPLQRNCTLEELGQTALFLTSDAASAITGQVIYADSGYSIMGMPELYTPNAAS